MENKKEEINLFDDLGAKVHSFLDNLNKADNDSLKKTLEQIRKDIKDITKVALIRNLEKTDDPKITFSKDNNMIVETKNSYPNILVLAGSENSENVEKKLISEATKGHIAKTINSEDVEKKLISKATKGHIAKTIKELENLLQKKITEESYRDYILQQQNYSDVLAFLNINCIKIENQILSFENADKVFECNRIGLLLYILGFTNGHKLQVFGNDKEVYVYDATLNKTFICGNSKNYKTYIASGRKDLYDLIQLSQEDVAANFTIVDFHSPQQWESEIKNIVSPKKNVENPEAKPTNENQTQLPTETAELPIEITTEQTQKQKILDARNISRNIGQIVSKEEELVQNDTAIEQTENQNSETTEMIRSEFKEFYSGGAFDYKKFVGLMGEKHPLIPMPAKASSLNSMFGRNPYISSVDYTIAILIGDKGKIRDIEMQIRDKWYNESKGPDSQKIKDSFNQYFALKAEEEKKEFKKNNPELFRNLARKAQKLGGLPIPKEEYIQSLIEENRAKGFVIAERGRFYFKTQLIIKQLTRSIIS